MAFGYRPGRLIYYMVGFIGVGGLFANAAFEQKILIPKDPSTHPVFHPFIYSMDTFLPIISFFEKENWLFVDKENTWGQNYFWFHIAAGWVLTSLLVAALTGLIKKD